LSLTFFPSLLHQKTPQFVEHLLGRKYPGANIGPEPTTDRVVAIYSAAEDRRTPGATLAVNPSLPWSGLAGFGNSFLARFEGAGCSSSPTGILKHMTIIDTPGILSGEKQRIERSYDFVELTSWFAARSDLILLLFDPAKLDIADEFMQVIKALRGHDDKVRVVLNKADSIDMQELMRVYGALLWSLSKGKRSCFFSFEVEQEREREREREDERRRKERKLNKIIIFKKNIYKKTKNSPPIPRSLPRLCRFFQRVQARPHGRQPRGRRALQG